MVPRICREMYRVLADDGSFILNIGGSYNKGTPTRSLYHYKLLIRLVDEIGFYLAQDAFGIIRPRCLCPPNGSRCEKFASRTRSNIFGGSQSPHGRRLPINEVLKETFSADMHRTATGRA